VAHALLYHDECGGATAWVALSMHSAHCQNPTKRLSSNHLPQNGIALQ